MDISKLVESVGPLMTIAILVVMAGMKILDKMTDTKKSRSTTEDFIGKGQMDLTLSLARSRDDRQERLDRIQDAMLKQQQNSQETTNRFSDEISKATLTLAKAVSQMEILTAHQTDWAIRMADWDTRLGLFMEHQKLQDIVQAQMFTHIKTILTLIDALASYLIPKEPKEKDTSS
jgi:hypothetical protein